MLSGSIRQQIKDKIQKQPKQALQELLQDTKLLDLLLNDNEKKERIKYVNMTEEMQEQLIKHSQRLQLSQGALIGTGLLLLLPLLEQKQEVD